MHYRPEIDGLRALAVVPVILFHAGIETFSGGYVGVDVFFVISGYLITTIIINEMDEGRFRLVNFYERRARRILPALFLVMIVCIPLAWMWLMPRDMKDFSQSLIAVAMFLSNVLFWDESGYFDTAAELKPLLHTWSLAVEEQYYILYPLFLILCWRIGRRSILAMLAVLFVLSLAAAHWNAYNDPAFAFYLLPTRGWELLIGVFAAFYLQKNAAPLSAYGRQAGSAVGLGLILYAVFAFDSQTPFPGLYALAPTVGTVLIILLAVEGTFIKRLLSAKVIVGVGLISYSAYLWHHPLLAFARYRSETEPSFWLMMALCTLTFPLAYLTWRYVENPFRRRTVFSRERLFTVSGAFAVAFIAFGAWGNHSDGFETQDTNDFATVAATDAAPDVMLVGDSHADHLFFGLATRLGSRISNDTSPGCIPFFNVDRYDSRFAPGRCAQLMNDTLERFIDDDAKKTIILSTMGPVYLDNTPFRGKEPERVEGQNVILTNEPGISDRWLIFERGMRDTLARLTSAPGKKVVFVIDVPELGVEERFCDVSGKSVQVFGKRVQVRSPDYDQCRIPRAEFDERAMRYHQLVHDVVDDFPSVSVLDPTALFCDAEHCYGYEGQRRLYRDTDHLSEYGSYLVAQQIEALLGESDQR